MTFTQCWCHYTETAKETGASQANYTESMNFVFANHSKEKSIYSLTTREIAKSQSKDAQLVLLTTQDGYSTKLVENIKVLCKDGKLILLKDLQEQAVAWYHHYLQHLGSMPLEETRCSAMYWKSMQHAIGSHVKKSHSCQVNKMEMHKYGKLPSKLAITTPWEAVCVDLFEPYTFKGKDGTQIDLMCVTMIDPTTSWFEIMELPVSQLSEHGIPMGTQGCKGLLTQKQKKELKFDKASATVGSLNNRTSFCCYPRCQYIVMTTEMNLSFTLKPYATHMG